MKARDVALVLAMVAQVVADRLPASVFATVLRYAGLGYVVFHVARLARAGYRRRLPYWTRDSWRRYFRASAIPAGAVSLLLGLTAAQDYHLLVIRPSAAILRGAWAAVILVWFLAGAWGLFRAIDWLTDGDPAQQFTRLLRRPGRTEAST